MKQYHVGDVLSISTGRLVAPRGMDAIYDILSYMTGESLMTHQLPRSMDECRPWLLRQYPGLAEIVVPEDLSTREACMAWLNDQVGRFGEYLPVEPIPYEDHARIDPIKETEGMVGPERVIRVNL